MFKISHFSLAPRLCKQALEFLRDKISIPVHLYRGIYGRPSPYWHDCSLCCALRRSHLKKTMFFFFFFEVWIGEKSLPRRGMVSIFWELTCYDADVLNLHWFTPCTLEGATTSHPLRQPPQERSMRSARSLSPPQSCTGNKCHRIEYELLTFGWASAARKPSFMQFLHGIGAVRTLNELMKERSQRFDSRAHEQIHTEAAELNVLVLHVNTKHHSAAPRRSTSKKN